MQQNECSVAFYRSFLLDSNDLGYKRLRLANAVMLHFVDSASLHRFLRTIKAGHLHRDALRSIAC